MGLADILDKVAGPCMVSQLASGFDYLQTRGETKCWLVNSSTGKYSMRGVHGDVDSQALKQHLRFIVLLHHHHLQNISHQKKPLPLALLVFEEEESWLNKSTFNIRLRRFRQICPIS